ncbi:MAG: hypothetical protein A2275_01770 [Bacteroidetes bacterium RIFOXYA12_FULL_35_11]|nr:MAG: hypothetical protein A2275_01770 [Bacteroidetes bacterium RIFOXYA12_FULL_35_11]HBX53784.1 hypothetical protein [Bacteroidales bacterium]
MINCVKKYYSSFTLLIATEGRIFKSFLIGSTGWQRQSSFCFYGNREALSEKQNVLYRAVDRVARVVNRLKAVI